MHSAARVNDPLYPFTTAYVLILGGLSLANLWQGYKHDSSEVRRRQFRPLFIATLLAALGGIYVTVGISLGVDLPELPRDVAFGVAVALLGFAVARHNALVEGRVIEEDLLYVFLTVGSLTVMAVLLAEVLYSSGHVFSFVTLVLVMVVTISALMLYDGVRTALDRLFYRDQFRQLRANLRSLANEAGTGRSLSEQLQAMLEQLCETLSIKRGFIALAEDGAFVVKASQGATPVGQVVARSNVLCDEIMELSPNPTIRLTADEAEAPRQNCRGMALLVPIAASGSQIGALLLGSRASGTALSGRGSHAPRRRRRTACHRHPNVAASGGERPRHQRHGFRVQGAGAGYAAPDARDVDRGQPAGPARPGRHEPGRVHRPGRRCAASASRLPCVGRPSTGPVGDCAPEPVQFAREVPAPSSTAARHSTKSWSRPSKSYSPKAYRPTLTPSRRGNGTSSSCCTNSYVLDELNRDIMSRLYIGEGTFNRTRRRALQGVARALQDMEHDAATQQVSSEKLP